MNLQKQCVFSIGTVATASTGVAACLIGKSMLLIS